MAYDSMNKKLLYEVRETSEMDERSKRNESSERKESDESEKRQRSDRRDGPTASNNSENSTYESDENGEINESSEMMRVMKGTSAARRARRTLRWRPEERGTLSPSSPHLSDIRCPKWMLRSAAITSERARRLRSTCWESNKSEDDSSECNCSIDSDSHQSDGVDDRSDEREWHE